VRPVSRTLSAQGEPAKGLGTLSTESDDLVYRDVREDGAAQLEHRPARAGIRPRIVAVSRLPPTSYDPLTCDFRLPMVVDRLGACGRVRGVERFVEWVRATNHSTRVRQT
jgi:hypothetical protein